MISNFDRSEVEENVREHYLTPAISSINEHGRFWHTTISRVAARVLVDVLEDEGFKVIAHELPPEWEFVFDAREHNYEDLLSTAQKRSELRALGAAETELPR